MDDLEYWEEMVGESFCEHGVEYDSEKVKLVAKDVSYPMPKGRGL